ncbi:MAG: hypothetical protein Q8N21_00615 [bacterium]|nr:hypothetical protein [bacterium]
MLDFIHHTKFEKEIAGLKRRFCNIQEGLKSFKRLCEVQFHPINPQRVIAPAKLHRITQNDIWGLWKIELVMPKSGLRPNQFPRMWFCAQGIKIGFLCIVAHADNYNDNNMNRIALERLSDIF